MRIVQVVTGASYVAAAAAVVAAASQDGRRARMRAPPPALIGRRACVTSAANGRPLRLGSAFSGGAATNHSV